MRLSPLLNQRVGAFDWDTSTVLEWLNHSRRVAKLYVHCTGFIPFDVFSLIFVLNRMGLGVNLALYVNFQVHPWSSTLRLLCAFQRVSWHSVFSSGSCSENKSNLTKTRSPFSLGQSILQDFFVFCWFGLILGAFQEVLSNLVMLHHPSAGLIGPQLLPTGDWWRTWPPLVWQFSSNKAPKVHQSITVAAGVLLASLSLRLLSFSLILRAIRSLSRFHASKTFSTSPPINNLTVYSPKRECRLNVN